MEKGVISGKKEVELWLQKHSEAYVVNAINKYKAIESFLVERDIAISDNAKKGSNIRYSQYIEILKLLLLGEDSEVLALNNKITELEGIIKVKDAKISELENSINTEYVSITKFDKYKEDSKEHYRKQLKHKNTVIAELKQKEARLNRGKKHIRGTEEFYRDVKLACSLIVTKLNKSGKQYNDYREAVKFAKTCDTIVNYSNANKVKINRENLQSWLSVAIALEGNVETKVAIGKYKANKGYKR
ncbi:hypothetical protein NMF54_18945 [Clostridioides difficile]|uniref:hypothetical protein n=1 Tax=Clostridioides difficile TaxID=1496 RepID=UPI0020C3025A|nr:hypothetical protein [Clostridioides difficile]MCP8421224.1 hypothetical protein [Clostridioides difficile]